MRTVQLLLMTSLILQADAIQFGGQIVGDTAQFETEEGETTHESALRRARVALKGKPIDDLKYEIEYSFTGSNDWRDVYLQYQFLPRYYLKLGNSKEPMGLEALSTSKYNTFMERSLTQAFLNKRKLGLQLHHPMKQGNHRYTFTVGVFERSLDEWLDGEESGTSLVGRTTYAHKWSKNELLHLGISASHTDYEDTKLRINTRPESDLFDRKLVSTKVKHVEATNRIGLEEAVVWNSLSLQGEYLDMGVHNDDSHYNFQSWYLQTSWFITGESRNYKAKKATFSRIKPKSPVANGGYGAWELALRTSYLDIDDKDEVESRERNYTVGLNWYLSPYLRLMTNYIHANLSDDSLSDQDIVQMRLQYEF